MSGTPDVTLSADHALELADTLQFIADWLRSDRARLRGSLVRFVGTDSYDIIAELGADLERFAFLVGGDPARFLGDPS